MIQITKKLTGKKYWRSLDQYYQTTEFQDWLNKEFPTQAQEMLDEPSRRNVLKLMAASFALGGLTACRRPVEHILPYSRGVENLHSRQAGLLQHGDVAGRRGHGVDGSDVTTAGRPRSKAIPTIRRASALRAATIRLRSCPYMTRAAMPNVRGDGARFRLERVYKLRSDFVGFSLAMARAYGF